VVHVAAAVEDHLGDAGLLGALGDRRADELRRRDVAGAGAELRLELRLERADRRRG
jgi:hypothetical protein